MKLSNLLLLITLCAVLLLTIAESFLSRSIEARLTRYLYEGNFEAYDRLRGSFVTRYLFNPFNLKFIDLNRYGMQQDVEGFENCLKEFDKMFLNKKQKETLYNKAFFYYVMKKDSEMADRYYHLLKDLNKPEIMPNIDLFHDTFIKKGHKYLDQVTELLENAGEYEKADYESLLAQMYDNMGNKKKAKQYTELAEKHFSELEKKMKEEL